LQKKTSGGWASVFLSRQQMKYTHHKLGKKKEMGEKVIEEKEEKEDDDEDEQQHTLQ
jgi:hypothetical protein